MSDGSVQIQFGADASQITPAIQQLTAQLKSAQEGVTALNRSAGAAQKRLDGLADSMRNAGSQMASLRTAGADAGMASLEGGSKRASTAMQQVAYHSTGVRRELIVMGHEVMTGNFSRLAGSLVVLAERWNGLGKVLLSGVGAGLVATAVGMGLAIKAAYDMAAAETEARNSLQLTSYRAGLSEEAFKKLSVSVAKSGEMTRLEASHLLSELNSTGQFTAKSLAAIGSQIDNISKLTGKSREEVVKDFQEMTKRPKEFAEAFSEQTGRLTADQYKQIVLYGELQEKEKQVNITAQSVVKGMSDIQGSVTALDGALKQLKQTYEDVMGAMARFFGMAAQTPLAMAKTKLAADEKERSGTTDGWFGRLHKVGRELGLDRRYNRHGGDAGYDARIAADKAEIARLQKQGDPTAIAANGNQNRTSIEDLKELDSWLTTGAHKAGNYQQALRQVRAALKDPRNSREANAAMANPGWVEKFLEAQDYKSDFHKEPKAQKAKTPKTPKTPNPEPDWNAQLKKQEIDQNDFFADNTKMEQDFWQKKLGKVKEGTAAYREVMGKLYEANKKAAQQEARDEDDTFREKYEAAKGNFAEQTKLAEEHYKKERERYKNNKDMLVRAEREYNKEIRQIEAEERKSKLRDAQQELQTQLAAINAKLAADKNAIALRHSLDEFLISSDKKLLDAKLANIDEVVKAEQTALSDKFARETALLRMEMAAMGASLEQIHAFNKQVEEEAKRLQISLAAIADDGENKKKQVRLQSKMQEIQDWRDRANAMAQSFTSAIGGMIKGTQNLRQSLLSIFNNLVSIAESAINKIASKWIQSHITIGRSAQAAANVQKVAAVSSGTASIMSSGKAAKGAINNDSLTAFSGAYQAIAKIPYVGPFLAPAAAVAAEMAVQAMAGSVMSGYGGIGEVPYDGMLGQLHAKEMVIPASLAVPMRAMLTGQDNNKMGGGGSDIHVHVHATDAASVKRLFFDNRGALRDAMRREMRDLRA